MFSCDNVVEVHHNWQNMKSYQKQWKGIGEEGGGKRRNPLSGGYWKLVFLDFDVMGKLNYERESPSE